MDRVLNTYPGLQAAIATFALGYPVLALQATAGYRLGDAEKPPTRFPVRGAFPGPRRLPALAGSLVRHQL
jgi:hypothetical protein